MEVHPREGKFTTERVSMGSGGDSFYEYLLKQSMLQPRTKGHMREQYSDAVDSALSRVALTASGMVRVNCDYMCMLCCVVSCCDYISMLCCIVMAW